MSVTQLIYSSRHRTQPGAGSMLETLRAIVSTSQRNNKRDGITGFLLYDRPWFFQILEGDHDGVLTTYNRIQKDAGHDTVELMALRQVQRRSFPEWSMGGAIRSLEQQEIFLRHGIVDSLEPSKVVAPTVLALAMELQDFEIGRREAFKQAS